MRLSPRILLLTLCAILLAACSTADDASLTASQPEGVGRGGVGDSLWFSLRLVAPAQPAIVTRAANDHGSVEEYAVKNGILVLFKAGASEGEDKAKVWKAYDISEVFADDPMNSITQSTRIIKSLSTSTSGLNLTDKLYALVLLNCQEQFSVDGETLKEGAVSLTDKTLSYFQGRDITNIGSPATGFFMSNAPVRDFSSSNVTTLVEVTNVFVTEHQASNSDATIVQVERAAAKIVVNTDVTDTYIIIDDNPANKLRVYKMEWAVDQYNTTSRVVRTYGKYGGSDLYDEDNMLANKCRTMWAVDGINYDTNPGSLSPPLSYVTPGSAQYVGEHTVSGNTDSDADKATRVVLKVTFKDASNVIIKSHLYAHADDKTHVFTTAAKRNAYVTTKGLVNDAAKLIEFTGCDMGGTPFPGATMYFTYPIKHQVKYSSATDVTAYGVVRDNIYRLTFKEIAEFGSATAP